MLSRKSKTRIDVFRNGRWEPVEKTGFFNRRWVSWLVFLGIISCSVAYLIKTKFFLHAPRPKTVEQRTDGGRNNRRLIAGLVEFQNKLSLIDSFGEIFDFETGGTPRATGKRIVKLTAAEKLVRIESSGTGFLLAINNTEKEPLIKFLKLSADGRILQDFIAYDESLPAEASSSASLLPGIFLTSRDRIIWLNEAEFRFQILNSPLTEGERIADLELKNGFLYVLGQKESFFRAEITRHAVASGGTLNWHKLVSGNQSYSAPPILPQILQIFDRRFIMISAERMIEEYQIDKNGNSEVSFFTEFAALKRKKPLLLSGFRMVILPNDFLKTEVVCLTDNRIVKCAGLPPGFQVRLFDRNNRRYLLVNHDQNIRTVAVDSPSETSDKS